MTRSSPKSSVPNWALASCLAIWVVYIAARSVVYAYFPCTNWDEFFVQDAAVTLLRLACLVGVGTIAFHTLGPRKTLLGLDKGRPLWCVLAAGLWMLVSLVLFWGSSPSAPVGLLPRMGEVLIALVVAANEEVAFRGIFFGAFSQRWGDHGASVITSILFVAVHWGVTEPWYFPFLFLIAMTLARLRSLGASLLSLVLMRACMDGYWVMKMPLGPSDAVDAYVTLGLMLAAGYIALEMLESPKRRRSGRPLA